MSDGSADALRRFYLVAIVQLLRENLVLFKAAYAVRSPNCETMLAKCWPIVCSRRGGYNVSDLFDSMLHWKTSLLWTDPERRIP